MAVDYNNIDILNWFAERNFTPTDDRSYPLNYKLDTDLKYTRIQCLSWLEKHNYTILEDEIHRAIINGQIDTLQWLEKRNIIPDHSDLIFATEYNGPNKSHVLDWITSKYITST